MLSQEDGLVLPDKPFPVLPRGGEQIAERGAIGEHDRFRTPLGYEVAIARPPVHRPGEVHHEFVPVEVKPAVGKDFHLGVVECDVAAEVEVVHHVGGVSAGDQVVDRVRREESLLLLLSISVEPQASDEQQGERTRQDQRLPAERERWGKLRRQPVHHGRLRGQARDDREHGHDEVGHVPLSVIGDQEEAEEDYDVPERQLASREASRRDRGGNENDELATIQIAQCRRAPLVDQLALGNGRGRDLEDRFPHVEAIGVGAGEQRGNQGGSQDGQGNSRRRFDVLLDVPLDEDGSGQYPEVKQPHGESTMEVGPQKHAARNEGKVERLPGGHPAIGEIDEQAEQEKRENLGAAVHGQDASGR